MRHLWDAGGVELFEAVRRRAMVRSFSADPVDRSVVERMVRAALRAPTAGNTGGTAWVVLEGAEQTETYWSTVTDEKWREYSQRWDGLRRAPVILLAYASAHAYVSRYAEADKSSSGLGTDEAAWPVPYWFGDAAFGVMTVLLSAVDAGLGACIMGAFRGTDALATELDVPSEWRLFCAVLLGRPDEQDHPSPSLSRPRPGAAERVHWGSW